MVVREQGPGPRQARSLWATTAPSQQAFQLWHPQLCAHPPCHSPSPKPQLGTLLNLLDGEPVAAQVLHGVYVIVAEETQADLAEGAGWHHLCHSHLQGGRCQEAAAPTLPPPPPHITCEASKVGKLAPSPKARTVPLMECSSPHNTPCTRHHRHTPTSTVPAGQETKDRSFYTVVNNLKLYIILYTS